MEKFILTTTLKRLRSAGACYDGYNKLVRSLQKLPFTMDDEDLDTYIRFNHKEEINLLDILKSNGIDDCLWSFRATTQNCDKVARLIAVKCVREVQNLITDPRSLNAIDVAERFARGEATEEERAAAQSAAQDAAQDAAGTVAWSAAWGVAWGAAGGEAGPAAQDAAGWAVEGAEEWAAAGVTARYAAWATARAKARDAAWGAAGSELEAVARGTARDVARAAARIKQAKIIKSFLGR